MLATGVCVMKSEEALKGSPVLGFTQWQPSGAGYVALCKLSVLVDVGRDGSQVKWELENLEEMNQQKAASWHCISPLSFGSNYKRFIFARCRINFLVYSEEQGQVFRKPANEHLCTAGHHSYKTCRRLFLLWAGRFPAMVCTGGSRRLFFLLISDFMDFEVRLMLCRCFVLCTYSFWRDWGNQSLRTQHLSDGHKAVHWRVRELGSRNSLACVFGVSDFAKVTGLGS